MQYVGPWMFVAYETNRMITAAEWRAEPYQQDKGSSFTVESPRSGC